MADEGQVIRGINWREAFPFTHIFRSFRIAVHLSKLALGLALLLSVYFGGRVLDWAWPTPARALPGEIAQYESIATGSDQTTLSDWREQTQTAMNEAYAQKLVQYGVLTQGSSETPQAFQSRVMDEARNSHYMTDLEAKIRDQRDKAVADARAAYANTHFNNDEDKKNAQKAENEAIVAAYDAASNERRDVRFKDGDGLFSTFFQYEVRQVTGVVFSGVLRNNWVDTDGVKDHLFNFFAVGPIWLIEYHTVFFVVFALLFLLAWSLFGGAISRIAAVHVARDEKISVRQAMNFAVGKLLSFASAPVIPLIIIIVIGLIVSVLSLIGNIPFLGPITVGALFILALLAGFVMTLVLLGTAGGFNLMYPTIAVEGSDSFDAISRSFSYVYARPWRMLFYTGVALAYGAATYLFVHMFIWLTLVLTHYFVGKGIFLSADNTRTLFATMWPDPATTGRLSYSADYQALTFGQQVGAFFMNCWVMLMVSFLGAFAISLYFSANTIIYFLMRGEVDSTELDDVYLEQSEDELEPVVVAAAVTTTTTTGDETAPPPAAPSTDSSAPSA
jgi:hypothetical protein